jgi:integrase
MSIHKRLSKRLTRERGRPAYVYDVRLRDPDGREYSRTFSTRERAVNFESAQRTDRARGTWVDVRKGAVTFGEWAQQWLEQNPAKRSSSRARDETIVRLHLAPLASRRLSSITPRDVKALVSSWASSAAPRTVRRQYGVLRAILAAAVEEDLIGRTPCRGITLPEVAPLDRTIITPEQLGELADAIGPNYAPMVYLGAVLGLRWGEAAGLRVGRVDFLRGTLTVAEQITRGEKGRIVEGPPKSNAGRRTLAVPSWLMDMLAEHLARRGLTGADVDARVFASAEGGPLDYSRWRRRVWARACAAIGLPGLTFHDLRRACATGLVAEGVDVRTAQARLGHSDPRLTLAVYAQATSDADRAAADRIGERFRPVVDDARARRAD